VPGHDERLDIDGTRFRLRRTTGVAAVGRFSGELSAVVARAVDAAAEDVRGSSPVHLEAAPGSPGETVEVDGSRLEGDLDDAPGPWAAVVERLRELLDRLVDAPEAAIAIEVDEDGRHARLVHRGTMPVEVDLSETRVSVHAWRGYYEPAGRWLRGPLALDAPSRAVPGWQVELPFDHGLALGGDIALQVEADFAIRDDDGWRPVGAVHVPVIEPPR
jgi:hypothetical protein